MTTPEAADFARLLAPAPAGPPDRPAEIPGGRPGSYPLRVLTARHPTVIGQVRDAHPYGPRQLAALDALHDEITTGTVQPLPPGTEAKESWDAWAAPYLGRPWTQAPFLWAEGYFYAKLLTAVDFWGPPPWRGVDPFAVLKRAELDSAEFAADIAALDQPAAPELRELLLSALWGNRADLGFLLSADPGAAAAHASHLLADDTAIVVELLRGRTIRRLGVLADNAGRELLADLVLLDRLLHTDLVQSVQLHLKPHPYFVSDAVLPDLLAVLDALTAGPLAARRLGERLDTALRTGRLVPSAHWFSGVPVEYDRMPADLRAELAACDLVLAKGDLNYRRLVGDREWPPTTDFADAVGDFPAPLAVLRTVKSDVLVGVAGDELSTVGRADPQWRLSGRYALLQTRL